VNQLFCVNALCGGSSIMYFAICPTIKDYQFNSAINLNLHHKFINIWSSTYTIHHLLLKCQQFTGCSVRFLFNLIHYKYSMETIIFGLPHLLGWPLYISGARTLVIQPMRKVKPRWWPLTSISPILAQNRDPTEDRLLSFAHRWIFWGCRGVLPPQY
jgi:hypothetical protein